MKARKYVIMVYRLRADMKMERVPEKDIEFESEMPKTFVRREAVRRMEGKLRSNESFRVEGR